MSEFFEEVSDLTKALGALAVATTVVVVLLLTVVGIVLTVYTALTGL